MLAELAGVVVRDGVDGDRAVIDIGCDVHVSDGEGTAQRLERLGQRTLRTAGLQVVDRPTSTVGSLTSRVEYGYVSYCRTCEYERMCCISYQSDTSTSNITGDHS